MGWVSVQALSVSANSSALSNSMHVLMKHCWPAAHCQLHCCLDDWSIEGLRAFVIPPPCSDSSALPPLSFSPSPSPFSRSNRSRPPVLVRSFVRFERISLRASSSTCGGQAAKGGRGLYHHVGERPKQRPRTTRSLLSTVYTGSTPLRASRTSPACLVPPTKEGRSLSLSLSSLVLLLLSLFLSIVFSFGFIAT